MRTTWQAFSITCLSLLVLSSDKHASYSEGLDEQQQVQGLVEQPTQVPDANQQTNQSTVGQPSDSQAAALDRLLDKASSLVARRENKKAQLLYRQALQIAPESSMAHAGLGWTLYDTGKHKMGMSEEHRALTLDHNNAIAHHYLANMYLISGRGQEAADEYRMEYKIAPKRRCHCGPIEQILKQYPPRR